jgi:bifunctional DNase/RNase
MARAAPQAAFSVTIATIRCGACVMRMALLWLAVGWTLVAEAREFRELPSTLVQVEVRGVGVDPETLSPAVLLGEAEGARVSPIYVGWTEAEAIERARRRARPERPLTHELLGDLLEASGAVMRRLIIDSLREGVYFAMIECELSGRDAPIKVDARPSDGIALALRFAVPILVAEPLLQKPGETEIGADGEITAARMVPPVPGT